MITNSNEEKEIVCYNCLPQETQDQYQDNLPSFIIDVEMEEWYQDWLEGIGDLTYDIKEEYNLSGRKAKQLINIVIKATMQMGTSVNIQDENKKNDDNNNKE